MAKNIHINKTVSGEAYDILITDSFERLSEAIDALPFKPYKLCIVTDSEVGAHYAFAVESVLNRLGLEVFIFTFPAGEERKNLDTVSSLYKFLIERRFDRKSALIALGGGVTGDLTGFAAATYLRGIPFIQVPTSLLADTDSSIGGKTGVDLDEYKNMVGAFYMPSFVYVNVATLDTLSEREFASGMAEIIKHGLIRDKGYYEELNINIEGIRLKDHAVLEDVIYKSLKIKAAVVEEDPTEKGLRAILNFGHTLGHAIERYMEFSLTHGECVALGSVAAMEISRRRGYILKEDMDGAAALMSAFGLPVRLRADEEFDMDKVIEITKSDKKMDAGRIKFILLKSIGEAVIDTSVTDEELREALEYILWED